MSEDRSTNPSRRLADRRPRPGSSAGKPAQAFSRPSTGGKGGFGGTKSSPRAGGNVPRSGGDRPRYDRPRDGQGGGDRPFRRENRPYQGESRPIHTQTAAEQIQQVTFRKWEGPSTRPVRPGGNGFRKPYSAQRGSDRPGGNFAPAHRPTDDGAGMASRRVALQVIRKVTEEGAYAALVLDDALKAARLSPEDRRLAARLAYDTMERMMYLDHALSQVMAREDTDIKLRNILRLGACQILLTDRIPESAATNTAVQLCRELGMEGLVGVCNGILRSLARKKDELTFPSEADDPIHAYSVRYSLPAWLVQRFIADWGEEEALQLMAHRGGEQGVALRANTLMVSDTEMEALLRGKGWAIRPGHLPHVWYAQGVTDVGVDPDFLAGKFSVQAEGSMMAALAVSPRRGMQVLDACAAPGGKACLLGELMGGTGRVQAWEIHPHRTELIAAQAKRLQLENIRPMTRDAAKSRPDLHLTMDAVLLDAPCTGLGVLADKPDLRLRLTEEGVDHLVALQAQLLDALAPMVKVGGTLVYATCSVLQAENQQQVEAFLRRHPFFAVDPLPDTIPEAYRNKAGLGLQLMPHREGMGGFYIARLRRTAR